VLLLVALVQAKTVVHSTKQADPALHPEIRETTSKYHVSANLMDLTSRVVELPEQTIPARHSHNLADLEEDEDQKDPVRQVQEIPEQSLEDDSQSPAPPASIPVQTKGQLHDLEISNRKHGANVTPLTADDADLVFEDSPTNNFGGVTSNPPQTGEKIEASTSSGGIPRHFTTAHWDGAPNPLLTHHNPPVQHAPQADHKLKYDSAAHQDEGIKFKSGGYEINIQHNHAKNFLDAQRVQVGTSWLGAHHDKNGHIARFRVRFMQPFTKRPVVFVTTVPEGAEKQTDIAPHPDVFAASVSEIRLDHFIVNVVRVDQFPVNGWGQSLYLDWIAMEYDSDYPKATTGGAFLDTHPAFHDLEHHEKSTNEQADVADAQSVHIPVQNDDEWDQ
jgi:hypothetical protein